MEHSLIQKLINILYFIGPSVLVLGFLIFIHELGHFLAARLVGIRVEVFSIGFGKRLFGFRKGTTDYRLSAIPFGGYVRMAGEELPGQGDSETPSAASPAGENSHPAIREETLPDMPLSTADSDIDPSAGLTGDTLNEKSVPQRILVAVAGAFMNGIVAILLTIALAYFGINIDSYLLEKPQIAHVQSGSPAEKAGLMAGDVITSVNHVTVETWEDAQVQIMLNAEHSTSVTINRQGSEIDTQVSFNDIDKYAFGGIGTPSEVIIGGLTDNSPAEKAGLQTGDRILTIDSQPLNSVYQLMDSINQSSGRIIDLTVQREENVVTLKLQPEFNEDHQRFMIGISFAPDPNQVLRRYPADQAIIKGIQLNLQMGVAMFGLVGKLVMGRESVDQLGGPVMIVDMAGKAARSGVRELIWLTALISLNLAILNLLPVPILDGGMVVFLVIEALIRRPVSEKIQLALQNVFFFLLIGFALYVTYNDVIRLVVK
ncbi:RIP metalloprotease RseP [bacterium]|nr:RIP metalloprotease RseP [candidate division CSSED10-310 bacterium]